MCIRDSSRLIYSKSPNIDAAKKYIDFITSQENLQYLIDNESGVLNLPYEGLTSEYPEDAQEYFDSVSYTHLKPNITAITGAWI